MDHNFHIKAVNLFMKAKPLENHIKLQEIQSRLTKYAYLSKEALPGAADALIFQKLKNVKKMPTKAIYQNFYHWYITVAQFALRQIESWKSCNYDQQNDKLINQCSALIESMRENDLKATQSSVDYIMNIFMKQPYEENMMIVKNKLLVVQTKQIGEDLKIKFKTHQERIKEYCENSNQLRVMFKLKPSSCQRFQELVLKWSEVQNIQVRKQMKQSKL